MGGVSHVGVPPSGCWVLSVGGSGGPLTGLPSEAKTTLQKRLELRTPPPPPQIAAGSCFQQ